MADAKRKKRPRKPVAAKVDVSALGQLMGPFSFGMSKDKILKLLSQQLDERYADKIKETSDIYQQDKLRREKKDAVKKIGSSYQAFKGTKTGWDVSIIDDQFGHKSEESMLVYWENNADGKDQRRFFFFHEGGLYKMFITLDSSMLPAEQRSFDSFKSLMVKRYGDGKVVMGTKHNGDEYPILVDWKSSKYHVQALDKLHFYGSFCLSIASPKVESLVMVARDANKETKRGSAVINSMLEGDDAPPPSLDANKAGVEAITNKR
ncbi:MAG: hypothetical protein GY811_25765 [Myxococcales bacterium]|nr:hypothetical protein [Myxococcales bacterium]